MARPTKYKEEYVRQAKKMCELGATDQDLAEAFGVSRSTLNLWKVQHKAFSDTLRAGKEPADNRVEAALYHRAIGYSHPDTDIRVIENEIVVTDIVKHYPPDTKAALAWLYNRKPSEWHPNPNGDGGGKDIAEVLMSLIDRLPS